MVHLGTFQQTLMSFALALCPSGHLEWSLSALVLAMLATATARAIPKPAGDEAQCVEKSRKMVKNALVALDKAEEVRPAGAAVPLDSVRAYYLLSQLQSVVGSVRARRSLCSLTSS